MRSAQQSNQRAEENVNIKQLQNMQVLAIDRERANHTNKHWKYVIIL